MAYDGGYATNRSCSCLRCKLHGSMGAAVLLTVGGIFLLRNLSYQWSYDSPHYWPLLLIVIGLMLFGQRSASLQGHVQPNGYPPLPGIVSTPPAATSAGDNPNPNPGSGAENV